MLDQSFIISIPRNLSSLKRTLASHHPVLYLYFGDNYRVRRNLEEKLGEGFVRLDIARLHDHVADEIRAEHVAWIDGLNRTYGDNLEWWFGPIASRNVYSSKLFQYSCYLEILKRIWDKAEERPRLIFTESAGLAKVISKWASEHGIAVRCRILARWQALTDYFRAFLRWGYFALVLLIRQIAARSSGKACGLNKVDSRDLAIVDTFILDSCLSEAGVFTNHYFPHLHEFLTARGFGLLVHPVLYVFGLHYFSVYRRMRRSNTHFIIAEDYLKGADYFYILTQSLRAARCRIRAPRFRGFDLSDLITEEQRNLADIVSLTAGQIYRLFLRLGESGLAPKLVIEWYENQSIDKALIAGARQAFPQARIIGAQIFLYSLNLLNLFPAPSEVEAKVTPDVMLAMSPHLCNITKTFTKAIPCYPAASLRYAYIFEGMPERSGAARWATVVILLPYDMMEALAMLETVKRVLDRIRKDIRLLIKCHPSYSPGDLKRSFGEGNWPERFEFFQGPIQKALQRATVVVSANSGAMVEAAAWGIPVIFLGRQTVLNQNFLAGLNTNLVTECFTENELVEGLNRYIKASPVEIETYRQEGQNILKLFFSPVNEKTMQPFIGEH